MSPVHSLVILIDIFDTNLTISYPSFNQFPGPVQRAIINDQPYEILAVLTKKALICPGESMSTVECRGKNRQQRNCHFALSIYRINYVFRCRRRLSWYNLPWITNNNGVVRDIKVNEGSRSYKNIISDLAITDDDRIGIHAYIIPNYRSPGSLSLRITDKATLGDIEILPYDSIWIYHNRTEMDNTKTRTDRS